MTEYRRLQAECRALREWLPVGFKCTVSSEALRTAIREAKVRRDGTKSPKSGNLGPASVISVLSLPGDLIEITGYYTTPFVTMKLITVDRSIAGRLGYTTELWKQKLRVERKGLLLADRVIGSRWYAYYRTINRRLEGGLAFESIGHGVEDIPISGKVFRASAHSDRVRLVTDTLAIEFEYYSRTKEPQRTEVPYRSLIPGYLDASGGISRDGLKEIFADSGEHGMEEVPTGYREPLFLRYYGVIIERNGNAEHSNHFKSTERFVDAISILNRTMVVAESGDGIAIDWGWSGRDPRPLTFRDRYPAMLPVSSEAKGGISRENADGARYINVYPTGTANIITRLDWTGNTTSEGIELGFTSRHQFPEVPIVVRAVWGHRTGEVLLLDPDGRIHLYNLKLVKPYRGVVDLPLCCDLIQVGARFVYVTIG